MVRPGERTRRAKSAQSDISAGHGPSENSCVRGNSDGAPRSVRGHPFASVPSPVSRAGLSVLVCANDVATAASRGESNVCVRAGRTGRRGGAAEEARSLGRDSACSADRPRAHSERLGRVRRRVRRSPPPRPRRTAASAGALRARVPAPLPYAAARPGQDPHDPGRRTGHSGRPGLGRLGRRRRRRRTRIWRAGSPAASLPARRAPRSSSATSTTNRAPPCSTTSAP